MSEISKINDLFFAYSKEDWVLKNINLEIEKGQNVSFDEILKNVEKRDLMDTTRIDSPLLKATDAIEVDNSETNREDQFHIILQLAKDRIAKRI